MIEELRQRLRALERPPGLEDGAAAAALGVPEVDDVLGGGLACGALHEIAALGEAHLPAAAGFVAGLCSVIPGRGCQAASPESILRSTAGYGFRVRPFGPSRNDGIVWLAEDMGLVESGTLYGPGLLDCGIRPENLLTVAVAHRRDLLWAMEEALRCRSVRLVVGEMRAGALDGVAVRRLSLAAAESGALALILRTAPPDDASTAATRWLVGAALSPSPAGGGSAREARRGGVTASQKSSPPPARLRFATAGDLPPAGGGEERFASAAAHFILHLTRNRRGVLGSWILTWSNSHGFQLATHAQPVAAPLRHRPHRAVA